MSASGEEVIVWDSTHDPPDRPGVYLWNGREGQGAARPLFNYVDEHAHRLRAEFLRWIQDVGAREVDGITLEDHFALDSGLSYWWLTALAEKSPYRAPIATLIRLLAIQEIVRARRPARLRVASRNHRLHEALSDLCDQLEIPYVRDTGYAAPQYRAAREPPSSTGSWLCGFRALARHIREAVRARRARVDPRWFDSCDSILFCDYFANLSVHEAERGQFHSRYWEGLPDLLREMGIRGHWIHHSSRYAASRVAEWLDDFNRNRDTQGAHAMLHSFFEWRMVPRILRQWSRLRRTYTALGDLHELLRTRDGTGMSLWPIVRSGFEASVCGPSAVANLFTVELFDAAMKALPHQRMGVYLLENNPWERAFVHAWRRHGHGEVMGFAHATVRFWDLRYHSAPPVDHHGTPGIDPDALLVTGPAAKTALLESGVPASRITEVEALRYLPYSSTNNSGIGSLDASSNPSILVIGDIDPRLTRRMLELLTATAQDLPNGTRLVMKPHPAAAGTAMETDVLDVAITTEPLSVALADCSMAFVSSSTSGVIDALLAGVPSVVMLDPRELNLSPVRGSQDVRWVSTPEALSAAIHETSRSERRPTSGEEYFFLDERLPRWRDVLRDAVQAHV